MELEIEVRKTVKVDVEIEEIVEAIEHLDMAQRWDIMTGLFERVNLGSMSLTPSQVGLVVKWLEAKLGKMQSEKCLLSFGQLRLTGIGCYEIDSDIEVESISLDFDYCGDTFSLLWDVKNIGDSYYPGFSSFEGHSKYFDVVKASLESKVVLDILIPFCLDWVAEQNKKFND
jgi:hypothetical protein